MERRLLYSYVTLPDINRWVRLTDLQAAANSAFTEDALSRLHAGASPKPDPSTIKPPQMPIVTIPTSLSGGEYTPFAGATDFRSHQKCIFSHPKIGPALIILDPVLCTTTPQSVWLASGMRAVDHCVEGLTSVFFSPESGAKQEERDQAQKAFLEGLKDLLPGLLATKKDARDVEARRRSMLGVVATMRGFKVGAPMGASHGIGHQLGPLGVGHGETSCVMLPAVLRWNLEHGEQKGLDWVPKRQKIVLDAFWGDQAVAGALEARGLTREKARLGDVVKGFVQELGLPSSLKDVGVGPDQFDKLAENSMTDSMTLTNPVPIKGPGDIQEILKLAAGN
jgi:alcohol dehydrogenase class IV